MKKYEDILKETGEFGEVIGAKQSLIQLSGLPYARYREIVVFENQAVGMIFSIAEELTTVTLLDGDTPAIGSKVVRTGTFPTTPVGNELLGRCIDPLGRDFFTGVEVQTAENRPLENEIIGIPQRRRVKQFFPTGITAIDLILPLGYGQKELVIGDRKTGKTNFLLATILNQMNLGKYVIYAAIGKKSREMNELITFAKNVPFKERLTLVFSRSSSLPGMIYLTPYTAMTIAEYFRDNQQDVVVILDDLSTHARFYREISLLSKEFPGRDSYPGDIFHIHANLLERSGNFDANGKEASITCFPVVETMEQDLTEYIPTNIMGMTDGHIFFDANLFSKGQRPAINIPLSVTRVGKQTQSALKKSLNREVVGFLTEYYKIQSYSHFGAELSEKAKKILLKGDLLSALIQQIGFELVDEASQLILLGLIWNNQIDMNTFPQVKEKLAAITKNPAKKGLIDTLLAKDAFFAFLNELLARKEELFA